MFPHVAWLLPLLSSVGSLVQPAEIESPVNASHAHGGQELLGREQCRRGSEYWCRDLSAAQTCNKVRYCMDSVWSAAHNSDLCTSCKSVVRQVRSVVCSTEVQKTVTRIAELPCRTIQVAEFRRECLTLVDDYSEKFFVILRARLEPSKLCTSIGLCSGTAAASNDFARRLHSEPDAPVPVLKKLSSYCSYCRSMVDALIQDINATSPDRLLNTLLMVCGNMGSFSDGCRQMIVLNQVEIRKYMLNVNTREFCMLSGFCFPLATKDLPSIWPEEEEDLGSSECSFCARVFENWRKLILMGSTKDEVKHILQELCGLAKDAKSQCLFFLEEYFEEFYVMLLSSDGKSVCTTLRICGRNSDAQETSWLTASPEVISAYKKMTSFKGGIVSTDQNLCYVCELLFHALQDFLMNDTTERQITHYVEMGCQYLPESLMNECEVFVEEYGKAIIVMLAQRLDPSLVCTDIHVCPPHQRTSTELALGGGDCTICKLVVKELLSLLKDMDPQEVLDELDKLCSKLPNSKLSLECKEFVNTFGLVVINFIFHELSPELICKELEFCALPETHNTADDEDDAKLGEPASNEIPEFDARTVKPKLQRESNSACIMCEYAVQMLHSSVSNESTDEEVRVAVQSVCHSMPKTIYVDCEHLLSPYKDLMVLSMTNRLSSQQQICQKIEMCPLVGSKLNGDADKAAEGPVYLPRCKVCHRIVEYFHKAGKSDDDDSQRNLDAVIEKVVQYAPEPMRQRCKDVIHQYGPHLVQLIEQNMGRIEVCESLAMCPSSRQNPRYIVGGPHCAAGASYWCISRSHAKACKAMAYCQNTVWKSVILY